MPDKQITLKNATVVTPDGVIRKGIIEIESGRIKQLREESDSKSDDKNAVDLHGKYVFPGFIDLHVHGGGGGSFNSIDPLDHEKARNYHLQHGTTSMLTTTSTTEFEFLEKVLTSLSASAKMPIKGSRVLGIHTEGPFISPQRNGAHHIPLILEGSNELMDRLISASNNLVSMVTVAPEIKGGLELIKHLISKNIVASLGHSEATFEEATKGIELGATSTTHTFNAMSPLLHREPGMVGAVLDADDIFCEAILDGIHIHPVAFRVLLARKGVDKVNLVTDSTSYAGEGDGKFSRPDGRTLIKDGGRIVIEGSNTLAGSSLNMNMALKNCLKFSTVDLSDLSKLTSLNAAKIIGRENDLGSIESCKIADLVVLDANFDTQAVMMEGAWVRNELN
jgi:N-acetylglucosamine-6-phosphate deacetylase